MNQQVLNQYKNGNTTVTLFSDGSLHREFDETLPIQVYFPSSLDVKITNYCEPTSDNPICAFCHEKSNLKGKHADLIRLAEELSVLPAGVEIAIGGGNPLSHPDLITFLQTIRKQGLIPNITINQKHIKNYQQLIEKLIIDNLVFGVGISYSDTKYLSDIEKLVKLTDNLVFHVIIGINQISDIDDLWSLCHLNKKTCKVLVLGYKHYGLGIDYYLKNKEVEDNKYNWYTQLALYFAYENIVLSFDNLALQQLNAKRYFTPEAWNTFYMGKDGQYTMYIDAVEQNFAMSSTNSDRLSFKDSKLINFFKGLSQ